MSATSTAISATVPHEIFGATEHSFLPCHLAMLKSLYCFHTTNNDSETRDTTLRPMDSCDSRKTSVTSFPTKTLNDTPPGDYIWDLIQKYMNERKSLYKSKIKSKKMRGVQEEAMNLTPDVSGVGTDRMDHDATANQLFSSSTPNTQNNSGTKRLPSFRSLSGRKSHSPHGMSGITSMMSPTNSRKRSRHQQTVTRIDPEFSAWSFVSSMLERKGHVVDQCAETMSRPFMILLRFVEDEKLTALQQNLRSLMEIRAEREVQMKASISLIGVDQKYLFRLEDVTKKMNTPKVVRCLEEVAKLVSIQCTQKV